MFYKYKDDLIDPQNPSDFRFGAYFDHLVTDPSDQEIESMLEFLVPISSQAKEGRANG